jgi:hypothetical protein
VFGRSTPASPIHHSVPVSDGINFPLGFLPKLRLNDSPDKTCERTHMKTERCMTQSELAERWRLSEATLERWRTESAGPLFLKLGNQVRYRLQDVEAFEEVALRGSTKLRAADPPGDDTHQSNGPVRLARRVLHSNVVRLYTVPRKTRLRSASRLTGITSAYSNQR